jgi:hypothetical protein
MNSIVVFLILPLILSANLQQAPSLHKCSNEYASKLEAIVDPQNSLGGLIYRIVKERLPIYSPQAHCHNSLVINASPGSSGTRSLFLAMLALNVTSAHYYRRSFNCTYGLTPLVPYDKVVFWGDTPFAHLWWYFQQACPSSRYVLTIIDPAKWHSARSSHYNTSLNADIEWDYILPIPFLPPVKYPFPPEISPPLPADLTSQPSTMTPEDLRRISNALSLKTKSADVAAQAYSAFVDLVKCAIPPKRLLLLDFNTQLTSGHFWTSLVSHMGLSLSVPRHTLDELIATGMPYWGRKACRLGGVSSVSTTCPFNPLLHHKQRYVGKGWPGVCK